MAITSSTRYYRMTLHKFENVCALQRKITIYTLLPDVRQLILAIKSHFIQALMLNTVQAIVPLTFLSWRADSSLDSLSINFILTSSRPWHTGSEKCLYTRSSLSVPSTDSLQCTLKRGFWLLNISLSFVGLDPTYCHDTPYRITSRQHDSCRKMHDVILSQLPESFSLLFSGIS